MSFINTKHKGIISNFTGNGIHCAGALRYFQTVYNNQTIDVATETGFYSSNDDSSQYSEIVLNPSNISISSAQATLSNVTVWSANSILTQGRGDARYQATGSYLTSANLTWSNITGKPTFANVATSGNYTDLANTPNLSLYYLASNPTGYITASCLTYSNITGTPNLSLYLTTANAATTYLPSANFTYANIGGTIPTATNTTLGAIKVGSNLTIANGVLSATSSGGGFQNGDVLNGGTF